MTPVIYKWRLSDLELTGTLYQICVRGGLKIETSKVVHSQKMFALVIRLWWSSEDATFRFVAATTTITTTITTFVKFDATLANQRELVTIKR